MAYCRKCGKEIDDEAVICPYCGVQQKSIEQKESKVNDSGSIGWAILGFLIPPLGIILWLAWMGVKPKCSRMVGLGVLAMVVLLVVSFIVLGLLLSVSK